MGQIGRIAVLYHYYEADSRYRDNLIHFLALTLDLGHPIFIAASSPLPPGLLPDHPLLTVWSVRNHAYDFGGHAATLSRLADRINEFDAFLFVNCSVRGPFLQVGQGRDWPRIFTSRLTRNTHLVGATACDLHIDSMLGKLFQTRHGPRDRLLHIQSTAYALSREGVQYLNAAGFYEIPESYGKFDIIADFELRMTDLILQKGWDVECLMPIFAGVDFHAPDIAAFSTSDFGNLIGAQDFLGIQLAPGETIFTKVSLKDQDMVALIGASYNNLRRNSAAEGADWLALRELTLRLRVEGEAIARRHLAAQKSRGWRSFRALQARINRRWQEYLLARG